MTKLAVALSGVSKVFLSPWQRRSVVAVRDLSLEVSAGQIYGLLGPNGSGKSTTLKIILGLIFPTRGKVEIFGKDSCDPTSRVAVGFLPENPYFYKYLTANEALQFYGKLSGLRGPQLRRRIDELLELVDLTKARDRRLSGYSKGMLQRIGLAQAIIHEPKLVILDEPTAGVDPAGAHEIRDLILALRARGITVLLSSHLLGQVQEICDRVGILANGILMREGALKDLLSIENQTDVVLEHASPNLLHEIEMLAARSGARVVEQSRSRTSLERLFLEATRTPQEAGTPNPHA